MGFIDQQGSRPKKKAGSSTGQDLQLARG